MSIYPLLTRWKWPLLLAITLLLRELARTSPALTEAWYSRGLFTWVSTLGHFGWGWLPFPATYLLFIGVAAGISVGIFRLFQQKNTSPFGRLWTALFALFNAVCACICWFYWLWGFNYSRLPVESQLHLPEIQLTPAQLTAAFEDQTATVLALRLQLQADTALPIDEAWLSADFEDEIGASVEDCLKQLGLLERGWVRGRQPFWDGFLLRFGAAGIYNPFTMEGNIDRGLHPLSKPYTMAHEFCHGFGWGDEGTCNFLAYLALSQSERVFHRYSAELGYWRELAFAYRKMDSDAYLQRRAQLPSGFTRDLDLIYRQLERYPEFFESFRRKAYDQYLKSQGISEGLKNYDKIIPLVIAWKQKAGDIPTEVR